MAKQLRGWLSIAFLASVLLIVTSPIETRYRSWTTKKRQRGYLRDLPDQEAALFRRCALNAGRATYLIAEVGMARSLEKKGLLWQSDDRETGHGARGYSLTHEAHFLLKEPEFAHFLQAVQVV